MPDPLITLSGHTEAELDVLRLCFMRFDAEANDGRSTTNWAKVQAERAQLLASVIEKLEAHSDLLAIATELHKLAVGGGVLFAEHVEAVWTSRGLAPPISEGAE